MSNIYKEEIDKKELYLPLSIDEYISENNQVRAVEDFVEMLDMVELGFANSDLKATDGQPAYHPKLLLKIYIYGYLNKIRSSRALEREIGRNIEMMWLTQGLRPSYKTIANFRKNNPKALQTIFREFSMLLKNLKLITGDLVAVDGAFLRANASKNTLIIRKTVKKEISKIDEDIKNYMTILETTDKQNSEVNINISKEDIEKLK